MERKSLWMRLLAVLLVCGMVLCCFAGCSGQENTDDKDDEKDKASSMRKKLEEYEVDGLLIYLGKELLQTGYGFETEDEDMCVYVEAYDVAELEENLDTEITSAKDLMNAYADYLEDEEDVEILEKEKKNGTYYLYGRDEDTTAIVGFYLKDGYGWFLTVQFDDKDRKDTAIKYATLGKVQSLPDEEDVTNRDESSVETTRPVETVPPTAGTDVKDEPAMPEKRNVRLKIWTPASDQDGWLQDRLEEFAQMYPDCEFIFPTEICGEGDTGVLVSADPYAAADVYMFANEQLGMLCEAGALAQLEGEELKQVLNDNADTLINSVTYTDGNVYGYPVANNTWFMYYNKSVYNEGDVQTLDRMLEKGKVSMALDNAWYSAAFFAANGCTIFGERGNSLLEGVMIGDQAGYEAAEAMIQLAQHPNFVNDYNFSGVTMFSEGEVDAVFSGSWDYEYLSNCLGSALGCAALPTVTIAGQQKQLKAFAGSKVIGVNPHSSDLEYAHALAAFLASETSQLSRYKETGVVPAHKDLIKDRNVRNNPVALAEMDVIINCSIVQPTIPAMSAFWNPVGEFGKGILNGEITLENYVEYVNRMASAVNEGYL